MMKKVLCLALSLILLAMAACTDSASTSADTDVLRVSDEGYTEIDTQTLATALTQVSPTDPQAAELSAAEIAGIAYMREEEKLARDVYLFLGNQWQVNVFENIALSEQSHMDAVLTLIQNYALSDPAANTAEGQFVDATLQGLYDSMTAEGSLSLVDALMVGAAIEEVDILDIEVYKQEVIDNPDIILVYDSLLKGSRNHLRAFVRNLEQQGISYTPRYLSVAEYEAVMAIGIERGGH